MERRWASGHCRLQSALHGVPRRSYAWCTCIRRWRAFTPRNRDLPSRTRSAAQRRQYLEDLARQIESAASVCVIPEYLERREVIDGLCEAASGVDLIVAATHGYGMLGRLWHGSQLHEMMRRLATPLLVVRGNGLRAAIAPDRCLRQMLVPLDGTESAERVLDAATALGSLYGAGYSLLRVVPLGTMASSRAIGYSPGGPFTIPGMAIQAEAHRYLRTAEKRMRKKSAKVGSRMVITDESIAQAIVSRASLRSGLYRDDDANSQRVDATPSSERREASHSACLNARPDSSRLTIVSDSPSMKRSTRRQLCSTELIPPRQH